MPRCAHASWANRLSRTCSSFVARISGAPPPPRARLPDTPPTPTHPRTRCDAKDAAERRRHVCVAGEPGRGCHVRQAGAGAAARGRIDQPARPRDPPLHQGGVQRDAGCRAKCAGEVAFRETNVAGKVREADVFPQPGLEMIENPFQAPGRQAAFSMPILNTEIEQHRNPFGSRIYEGLHRQR